jgi:thiamine-phosphate diphosphorylase
MPLPRRRHLICLVTDRGRLSPGMPGKGSLDRLVALTGAAVRAGVDLIQIRERDLETRDLFMLVERCVAETAGTASRILVNDRTDVALAAGAAGVHLRSDSIDAAATRRLVLPDFIVGRSVHSPADAVVGARERGADYLVLGTMFPSGSKPAGHVLTGLDGLRRTSEASALPVLAIGGITVERARDVVGAGAAGIAAIGLFIPPQGGRLDRHLEECVGRLRAVFDTCGLVT